MDYPTWYLQVYGISQFPKNDREYWERVRDYVVERDRLRCQACRKRGKRKELTVHHIIPRAYGGNEELDNLITLHFACHDYVEAQGFRTRAEIINCTKNLSAVELKNAAYHNNIDIPVRNNPTTDTDAPTETDRVEIICPCGIYHIRKQSLIGSKITKVDCVCGQSATYQKGEWIWKARYTKPEPEPEKQKQPKNQKRHPKPKEEMERGSIKSDYLYSVLTCPMCNLDIQYRKDTKGLNVITCRCGSQAFLQKEKGGWVWVSYVELYRDVLRDEKKAKF
jgi:hypothetical protein